MYPQRTVELLVGDLGVGKSTYAAYRARSPDWTVVNRSVVHSMVNDAMAANAKLQPELYQQIEVTAVTRALQSGLNVVVDRMCHRRETRVRYATLARITGCEVHAVVFPREDPVISAQRRFMVQDPEAPGNLPLDKWLEIANDIYDHYEPVELSEGFARIQVLTPEQISRIIAGQNP